MAAKMMNFVTACLMFTLLGCSASGGAVSRPEYSREESSTLAAASYREAAGDIAGPVFFEFGTLMRWEVGTTTVAILGGEPVCAKSSYFSAEVVDNLSNIESGIKLDLRIACWAAGEANPLAIYRVTLERRDWTSPEDDKVRRTMSLYCKYSLVSSSGAVFMCPSNWSPNLDDVIETSVANG